jgi:hypothetical protein
MELGIRSVLRTMTFGALAFLIACPAVAQPAPQQTRAEGWFGVKWDAAHNTWQWRKNDSGYQNITAGQTFSEQACLHVNTGRLANVKIQTSRNLRPGLNVLCGSDPRQTFTEPRRVCFTIDISINANEEECRYNWVITGDLVP